MDDAIIWDGAVQKFIGFLGIEIIDSAPSIQEQIYFVITDRLKDALYAAQEHHEEHIKDTELKQESLDIYKALSWLTCMMSHQCKSTPIFNCVIWAGIRSLNDILQREKRENKGLPDRTQNLMNAMFKNELAGIPQHGIERNGLFMSFHTASEMLKHHN